MDDYMKKIIGSLDYFLQNNKHWIILYKSGDKSFKLYNLKTLEIFRCVIEGSPGYSYLTIRCDLYQ